MIYTSEPWEVEKDPDLFGRYKILEAAREEFVFMDEGYKISDEEGERREKESEERNEGNRRIMKAAPRMFRLCREMIGHLEKHPLGKGLAETLKEMKGVVTEIERR